MELPMIAKTTLTKGQTSDLKTGLQEYKQHLGEVQKLANNRVSAQQ